MQSAQTKKVGKSRRRPIWPRILLLVAAAVAAAGVYGMIRFERYSLKVEALGLVAKGKFGAAEPKLKEILTWAPNDPQVLRAWVKVHQRSNKLAAELRPYLDRWCAAAPDDPEPFRLRMDLWVRLGRRKKALDDALRIKRLAPEDASYRKLLVSLLYVNNRLVDAEQEIHECLKRSPGDADLLYLLAKIYDTRKQYGKTDAVLKKLMGKTPVRSRVLVLRGKRLLEMKEHKRAVAVLERVLLRKENTDQTQQARYLLSRCWFALGDAVKAGKLLEQNRRHEEADQLDRDSGQQPGNAELAMKAAKALLDVGQSQRALQALYGLLRHHPRHRQAHLLMAAIFESMGDSALAAKHRRLAAQ